MALTEELEDLRDSLNDRLDRIGDVYYWQLARKARVIAATGMITNLMVFFNAAFFSYLQLDNLSISPLVAVWAYKISGTISVSFAVLTIIAHFCYQSDVFQRGILLVTLSLLTITLALFNSFVGFFDGLTWFTFFMYTSVGFLLLSWQQVSTTVFGIVSFMVLMTVFHSSLPYPVQAYMFSRTEDIASMSFFDLLAAWGLFSTSAFMAVATIGILMRNWHTKGRGQGSHSKIDELTQVMKRRAVLDALEDEVLLAAEEKKDLTVAVIDLDSFKGVNAQFGHVFGDKALVYIAQQLVQVTRKEDLVGRFGGQEFIIVFPGCTVLVAAEILERVKQALLESDLQNDDGERVSVTFSAGLSRLRPGDSKYENIIARADKALAKAKDEGKDRIVKDTS